MLLNFFPSRALALYLGKTFLLRCLAMLAMLVLILQMLDLLSEAGKVLAYPGNGDAQLWQYVSLRAPQIISRFLPFSVLLGTLITLATLNANSEVVAMKSGGLSAHQILAPLILASLAVAAISYVFNERVVVRATATLTAWEAAKFGPIPSDPGVKGNVWVRHEDDLIRAGTITGRGNAVRLQDVNVYDRHNNALISIVYAKHGRFTPDGWLLEDIRVFDVVRGVSRHVDRMMVGKGITPDQFTLSSVDPDAMSFSDLSEAIDTLREAGRPVASLEGSLWHKISGPLSALLMPLLGSVAAFGIARSGKLFVRAVIGMALGFAFFVADNFALSMGNLGVYPPMLAAWAPFLLFLVVGEAVLITTEE
ncbi:MULTISPECIES: LPS export ABC transporter permease LptG [unclassified Sphingobium]|uniref:LPS export ABC transporter permease LptG n=1 Tax=unclassified Sphingobium TaxID=2611147 RepID=UPI0022254C49|nr:MULTISPECIES: LPS export ABC transporter permease LptG [unclassified Sphingobium]MCW2396037.1 lipopolysaccharide export system permease protein [Sphingobium sp. B8D3B]MCW2419553.1 lipopolysaccharide export system permease protein [Sphingobium sp. B8D3C]